MIAFKLGLLDALIVDVDGREVHRFIINSDVVVSSFGNSLDQFLFLFSQLFKFTFFNKVFGLILPELQLVLGHLLNVLVSFLVLVVGSDEVVDDVLGIGQLKFAPAVSLLGHLDVVESSLDVILEGLSLQSVVVLHSLSELLESINSILQLVSVFLNPLLHLLVGLLQVFKILLQCFFNLIFSVFVL